MRSKKLNKLSANFINRRLKISALKELLDSYLEKYNDPDFIQDDPISIPHMFSDYRDIEIIGLWTAILSWGLRKTIINKSKELCNIMDYAPYDFIMNHTDNDLKRIARFKHRTFNGTDALCFVSFFKWYYTQSDTLEDAFIDVSDRSSMKNGIYHFFNLFISAPDFVKRTRKHVANPMAKSSCKRINMFLRWMVRKDEKGVDFGLWNRIGMDQLLIPLDVHVYRVARKLGLLERKQTDWTAVELLTEKLRMLNPSDPVVYDYALFGMGIEAKKIP